MAKVNSYLHMFASTIAKGLGDPPEISFLVAVKSLQAFILQCILSSSTSFSSADGDIKNSD